MFDFQGFNNFGPHYFSSPILGSCCTLTFGCNFEKLSCVVNSRFPYPEPISGCVSPNPVPCSLGDLSAPSCPAQAWQLLCASTWPGGTGVGFFLTWWLLCRLSLSWLGRWQCWGNAALWQLLTALTSAWLFPGLEQQKRRKRSALTFFILIVDIIFSLH